MDGTITPEEILSRIPKGADTVYVKPEDNKAYWVKGEETDSLVSIPQKTTLILRHHNPHGTRQPYLYRDLQRR